MMVPNPPESTENLSDTEQLEDADEEEETEEEPEPEEEVPVPSSSGSIKNEGYLSSNETNDDVGWWDCSLCTYRNSADKFKCEICDLRRGTSTRKPRCNADTIVAQVVKQQEQIRQQTRVKTPKSRSSTGGGGASGGSSSGGISNSAGGGGNSSTSTSNNAPPSGHAPAVTTQPPQSIENTSPQQVIPIEINGKLIKYKPPTSCGRNGLVVDKKRFTQHSVTVNDVTITFTEFATRQNNYVRKRKKRRE